MTIREQSDFNPNSNANKSPANTIEGEAFWQEHIKNYHTSNLSKAEYARRHDLNYARFLYWYRRNADDQTQNKLLPITLKPVATSDKLCSINIVGHELQIYDLSVLEHLLNRLS
jgi:hypothetical protein